MNEEDRDAAYETLMEATALLYVLETALDNDSQPTIDTVPYACLAKLIKYKVADAVELIQ